MKSHDQFPSASEFKTILCSVGNKKCLHKGARINGGNGGNDGNGRNGGKMVEMAEIVYVNIY